VTGSPFYWPGYIILGPLEKHTGNLEMPVFDAYIFYQLEVLLTLDYPIVNKVASFFFIHLGLGLWQPQPMEVFGNISWWYL